MTLKSTDGAGTGVSVGVSTGGGVGAVGGVFAGSGVSVGAGTGVSVGGGVSVGFIVGVGTGVLVAVLVGSGVPVAVLVGSGVPVGVLVAVAVAGDRGVLVGVGVIPAIAWQPVIARARKALPMIRRLFRSKGFIFCSSPSFVLMFCYRKLFVKCPDFITNSANMRISRTTFLSFVHS
jgi:hypothetical protein